MQNHWAKIFIDGLVERAVISGFPDRTFRRNTNLNPRPICRYCQQRPFPYPSSFFLLTNR
ncbi:MAG: S-layer homology domain-containing protein [Cyanobacteria bacterium 0813]|nr:S-layer homology domain-containing protein [Cyanobacteria bacterium 0813]